MLIKKNAQNILFHWKRRPIEKNFQGYHVITLKLFQAIIRLESSHFFGELNQSFNLLTSPTIMSSQPELPFLSIFPSTEII